MILLKHDSRAILTVDGIVIISFERRKSKPKNQFCTDDVRDSELKGMRGMQKRGQIGVFEEDSGSRGIIM